MDCQKGIGEYNKGKPENGQFHIRIGLHMGEAIHTGTDVFGESVNIAARVEPKADPDGIAVSDAIVNAVRNKVPAHFASMGRLPMKNIANPPELFKVFPLEEKRLAESREARCGGGPRRQGSCGSGGARFGRTGRRVQDLIPNQNVIPDKPSRLARRDPGSIPQNTLAAADKPWIPAFAGMTVRVIVQMRVILPSLILLVTGNAIAADKLTVGTDWRAQAEHGGYYQALATGLYAKAGLDVTIRQGGPQVNHSQLLAAGKLDISIAPNSFIPLNFAEQKVPVVVVASMFQKDPAVLIAHAGQGNDTLAALKGKKIMISPDTRIGFWRFLKTKYAFTDDQIAPYTFNLAPFFADPKAVQQGYATSEPFQIERSGVKPVVMLLSDSGYASYASLVVVPRKMVSEHPELVQRFVDATIAGWESYLNGDPAPANALIKKDNPDMSDELLAYGRSKLKDYGIISSGEALTKGLGVMNDTRWKEFFDLMAADGLYPKTMGYKQAYTLQFIGKAR